MDRGFDEDLGKKEGVSPPIVGVVGSMRRNEMIAKHFEGNFREEDSPSYKVLSEHKLLTKKYRLDGEGDLVFEEPNSTRTKNCLMNFVCCPLACLGIMKNFFVPNGHVRLATDGRGNYSFHGPGVHQILDPFYSIGGLQNYATETIVNGDRTIVTVPQGYIGYCTNRGQPVLLPPGLHQWRSAMLKFDRLIALDDPIIPLGPWTLLTIDQGYMAVTQDNGRQVILDGGDVYLLTHQNWKFEKFVSTKIQTNELTRIEAASADNVVMLVDATVLWRIEDVETAVRMSAETMDGDGNKGKSDILKLRNDVLKQAEASLAFFIGTINFSDTMAAAALHQRQVSASTANNFDVAVNTTPSSSSAADDSIPVAETTTLYNSERLRDAVAHANKITQTYGVVIKAINIISAIPEDRRLQASLAAGAVAAAEAQMMETAAQGKGKAIEIEATALAKKTTIIAQADAAADVLRAEGAKKAAELLTANTLSADLAKIDRTGAALAGYGNHATFFFGTDTRCLSSLLSNNDVVKGAPYVKKQQITSKNGPPSPHRSDGESSPAV